MAMARHAPYDQYTRALGITDHAVERLRERLDRTALAATTHRSDIDLGNMIDQATMDAFHRNDFEEENDNGAPLRIARLQQLPSIEPLYALVKPNNATEMGRYYMPFVVVTLYTQAMIANARRNGRWNWAGGDSGSHSTRVKNPGKLDEKKTAQLVQKLGSLGSKLRTALELAEMKGQPVVPVTAVNANVPPAPPPTRPNMPRTPPTPAAAPPVANATEMYMVTYFSVQSDLSPSRPPQPQVVEFQKAELKRGLGELHSDKRVDATSIRVWREVKATVKVVVDVEIGD